MEIFWNLWFWLGAVAIVAIVAGSIVSALKTRNETRKHLADAANGGDYRALAERSEATSGQLLARLTEVEARLATIEKTLTDIP